MYKDDKAKDKKEDKKEDADKVKAARSLQDSIMEGDDKKPVIQPFEVP